MKTIPQIRTELLEVADNVRSVSLQRRIKNLVKQMYRRSPVRRAAVEHVKMTVQKAREIRQFARDNKDLSYAVIGRAQGVSIGRVSEALAGKRSA